MLANHANLSHPWQPWQHSMPCRLTTVDEFVDECASSPICDVVGFDSWRTLNLISLHYFFRCDALINCIYFFLRSSTAGIYPDLLHICDLALYLDLYGSAFILWTDDQAIFPETSRDARLLALYKDYLNWCIRNRSLLPCLVLMIFVMYSSLIWKPAFKVNCKHAVPRNSSWVPSPCCSL